MTFKKIKTSKRLKKRFFSFNSLSRIFENIHDFPHITLKLLKHAFFVDVVVCLFCFTHGMLEKILFLG